MAKRRRFPRFRSGDLPADSQCREFSISGQCATFLVHSRFGCNSAGVAATGPEGCDTLILVLREMLPVTAVAAWPFHPNPRFERGKRMRIGRYESQEKLRRENPDPPGTALARSLCPERCRRRRLRIEHRMIDRPAHGARRTDAALRESERDGPTLSSDHRRRSSSKASPEDGPDCPRPET